MSEDKITARERQELEEMAAAGIAAFTKKGGDVAGVDQALNKRINDRTPVRKIDRRWFAAAAAIALLLAAFFIWQPLQQDSSALHLAYYEAPPFVLSESARGEATSDFDLSAIRSAYADKDFGGLLTLVSAAQDEADAPEGLELYEGIALLETDQASLAIEKLKTLDDPELRDMQQWYLAMAYLKADDTDLAKVTLSKIVGVDQHYKQKAAQDILAKL